MTDPQAGPLARLRTFRGVAPADLQALAAAGTWLEFENGESISREGDDDRSTMILVDGRMRVQVSQGARDLGDLWPGGVIGESALFGVRTKRCFSVSSVGHSRVLSLTRDRLRALPNNTAVAALQRHVIEVTAKRLQTADLDLRRVWREEDRARHVASAPVVEPAAPMGLFDRLKTLLGVSA